MDSERRVHYDWVTNVREVSPWSLSYHVMVHEAEEEELISPSLECAKIPGVLKYFTANEYYEPPVIFRLIRPQVEITMSLCSHRSVDCEQYQEGNMYMYRYCILCSLVLLVTINESEHAKEARVEIKISLHLRLPIWRETVFQHEYQEGRLNFLVLFFLVNEYFSFIQ